MRFYVAITDSDWFDYLAELRPDEVNFRRPSGAESFRALSLGEPLLFKLHSPHNYIFGGPLLQSLHRASRKFCMGSFR